MTRTALLASLAAFVLVQGVSVIGQGNKTPMTPWGEPDLQGTWTAEAELSVPFERPREYGTRQVLSDAEFQQRETQSARQLQNDNSDFDLETADRSTAGQVGSATSPPPHWLERKKISRRTSLVIDRPDGRVPPLTREAQARQTRPPLSGDNGADRPQDLSLWVRCIGRGMPSAIFPTVYNANVQVVQAPGVVALTYEMIHDTRIIRTDGLPHVGSSVRGYFGDSRGHWEGDTLVVDVTNVSDKNNYRGSRDTLRLVERFTRVGNALRYEVTAEDAQTWTAPWTAALELEPQPDGMFEYACHEGNNSMRNILSGARAADSINLGPRSTVHGPQARKISLRASSRAPKVPPLGAAMDKRWTACLVASAACLVASVVLRAGEPQQPTASSPVVAPSPHRATLDRYCVTCHNARVKAGGLVLDSLDVASEPATWEKVVRKLRGRMMPPAGLPRPDEATYDAFAKDLESALDAAAARHPNPGRTDTFRRLSRVEYQNAIRDILDLDVDVSALLPKDDASHGFDNVANGELSPTLLERYLAAAQKVSRTAVGGPLPSPASHVVILPADLTQEDHLEGLPLGSRGGTVVPYNFPLTGTYEIQMRLARDRNENVEGLTEPQQVELTLDGQRVQMFGVKPNRNQSGIYYADEAVDKDLRTRIHVSAGPHDIGALFPRKTFALEETERQPSLAHFNMDRHPRVQIALYSVSIAGPFDAGTVADTPSRRRLFVCKPANAATEDACARQIVSTVARRAFRRAIVPADIEAPMRFYKEARAEGGFDAGVEMALRAVLASTEFLFRIERDPKGIAPQSPYRVSDVELASRLSFFLWSSVPDDELLDLAVAGRLNRPATLEQQVKRMLASPKADALVTNFAGQWLYLRNLAAASPDARTFPDFDDNLRQAFRRETELFVDSIMREDRSALDLLRANYTFVNERLAKHYGIPNVYGSRFRRVSLGDDSVRGGILGQGSVLTVTSYANRTSPVLRGKWILENIVGTPPPPPPQNVPPLKDTDVEGRVLSMRERMAQHRASPACAGCHQLMDPAGLSMENFDAIGRWRIRTESGSSVDASGGLPDGSTFTGMSGLRTALLRKPEMFVGTLTEKLMTYGLGRGLEYYDAPSVRDIVADARATDYRFSALVLGIVSSDPFQMRVSQ